MRRVVLGIVVGIGVLSLGVAAQRGGPQANAPKVVEVDKVKDNLYVLKGGGGNTALFITASGAVLVDTKLPGWGQPILEKVRSLTSKPITTIINTHTHGDHVSGQLELTGVVADVIAQVNTKTNMQKLDDYKKPENAKWLPSVTYTNKMSIGSGADRIDLYYFGAGHTNGDAWVVFPALRVAHAGDLFANISLPLVDKNNGGSVVEYPDTLLKAYRGIKNVDVLINGHREKTSKWAELKEYADFNRDFVTWVKAERKAGKSAADAAKEYKVPARYKGYSGTVAPLFGGLAGSIQVAYDELNR
jgi:glyoxylase-like metal-dependent hydrolase (beta-lactamase superfamily II)